MARKRASYSFHRVNVQTRSRKHTAVGAVCYRCGIAGESRFGDKDGHPKIYDYSGRRGIVSSGCALPPGAIPKWTDPLHWVHKIELCDYRKNSRMMRDDVLGIPIELVKAGVAKIAIARYATRIALIRKTPVHYAIHGPNGRNNNFHAHVMYAGRRLEQNGREFQAKRDREQDKAALVSTHKEIWKEVCAELGVVVDFSGPVSLEPKQHLGPKSAALERKACEKEAADRLICALRSADEKAPATDEWTRRSLGAHASHVAAMTATSLIDVGHKPRTRSVRRARRPRRAPESKRMGRLARALRDDVLRVGEGLVGRAPRIDTQEGFSILSASPKANMAAVALVDERLARLGLTRGRLEAKGRRENREELERVLEWKKWCKRKLDRGYKNSLDKLTIRRISEFTTASRNARMSTRQRGPRSEQPERGVRRSGKRSRSTVGDRKLHCTEYWSNAHVLALELMVTVWREYERERKERQQEARRSALVDLIRAMAPEVVRVGEERIRHRLQNCPVPGFRTLGSGSEENKVAVHALDECMSVVFGEDSLASMSPEEEKELLDRWRAFCSGKSARRDEEGLTHGQAVARVVAIRVLGRRWEKGAITEALLRQVKDQIVAGIESGTRNEDRASMPRRQSRKRFGSIGE